MTNLTLKGIQGEHRGKIFVLDRDRSTIGSKKGAHIKINHDDALTAHAIIAAGNILTPIGRVAINTKVITQPTEIKPGDGVQIKAANGKIIHTFKVETQTKPASQTRPSISRPDLTSIVVSPDYQKQLQQQGQNIAKSNLFELIRDNGALFMFGRKDKDLQDYHTIFHHYGKNVRQNSEVKPERMGSDLHAKITDVIRMHDKSRLLGPRQNTHIVEFTLPILQDAGHSVVGIQYITDSHDPYNRKINATLGIVLPNNLARQLVARLKTAPEKTLQKLYEHILLNEENQTKRLIPKPAIRETTLWHVTPEKRTRLQVL